MSDLAEGEARIEALKNLNHETEAKRREEWEGVVESLRQAEEELAWLKARHRLSGDVDMGLGLPVPRTPISTTTKGDIFIIIIVRL